MPPNVAQRLATPAEAFGGRCGMAEAVQVESGRWQAANTRTYVGACDPSRVDPASEVEHEYRGPGAGIADHLS